MDKVKVDEAIKKVIVSLMDVKDAINVVEEQMGGASLEGPVKNLQLGIKMIHYAIEYLRHARKEIQGG
jgi:hypothetical protein